MFAPHQTGIQRIEAYFSGKAYRPHRHDTYSIGYTINGVQSFHYRGARSDSTSGDVIVLHPDEVHDGHAGSSSGFRYRMLYIEPSLVRDALGASASALPFVKNAVLGDTRLLSVLQTALGDMDNPLEPMQFDQITLLLAESLLAQDQSAGRLQPAPIDARAIAIARDYLNANIDRVVRSEELEHVTQHDRYSLARQFRTALGTSPYRYLTMRRLDRARDAISRGVTLADAAALSGFSDQSHMTRQFTSAFGVSPGRWRALQTRL
ncbi:AraC family transcriptional regulator [uncultured Hoeflea sp.]|mgnify:FL=1|uniref:AraC family transcriptional regulator n=1 Tax=uncultured Hoeflea sp. TaxID=538666 RepID=UPI0030DA88DF